MSKEIKMAKVFNLPLKAIDPKSVGTGKGAYPVIVADCKGDMCKGEIGHVRFEQGPHSGTSKYMGYKEAEWMAKMACHAINNHDTLTEQVKQLREERDSMIDAIEEEVTNSIRVMFKPHMAGVFAVVRSKLLEATK